MNEYTKQYITDSDQPLTSTQISLYSEQAPLGTAINMSETPILDINAAPPAITTGTVSEINVETHEAHNAPYLAPRHVVVRRYKLKK